MQPQLAGGQLIALDNLQLRMSDIVGEIKDGWLAQQQVINVLAQRFLKIADALKPHKPHRAGAIGE